VARVRDRSVKPGAIICNRQRDFRGINLDDQIDPAGIGVPGHVVERLLSNTHQCCFGGRWDVWLGPELKVVLGSAARLHGFRQIGQSLAQPTPDKLVRPQVIEERA
jgi:hypothetical protein